MPTRRDAILALISMSSLVAGGTVSAAVAAMEQSPTTNGLSALEKVQARSLLLKIQQTALDAYVQLYEDNLGLPPAALMPTLQAVVDTMVRQFQGKGLYDMKVVCDYTNNSPEALDRSYFLTVDVYTTLQGTGSFNFRIAPANVEVLWVAPAGTTRGQVIPQLMET